MYKRQIIDKVCLIHSVDSVGLAAEIKKRAVAIGKVQQILIQVNISGEETKSGVSPDEVKAICTEISNMENVRIVGLCLLYTSLTIRERVCSRINTLEKEGVLGNTVS